VDKTNAIALAKELAMNRRTTTRRGRITGLLLVACLAVGLTAATAEAGTAGRWLHIRVTDTGGYGENVNVNVPLDMIAAFLPMIETDEMRGGKIRIDSDWADEDFRGIDLRKVLEALRDSPDTDFVTVRSNDENVRVSKEGGFIHVLAEDRNDSERVRVKVPLAVMEALIGNDPYELDLMAALDALADFEGDLVTVESDDEHVRIWIDSNKDSN